MSTALVDEVAEVAARSADPAQAVATTMQLLAEAHPRWGWVGVYLLAGDALHLGPYVGPETEHRRIPVGQGVCGTAVARGENQVVDDVGALDNYLACSVGTRSEIVVLVRHQGEVVGQIDVDSDDVAAFGPADERLLEQVAERIAPACAALAAGAGRPG